MGILAVHAVGKGALNKNKKLSLSFETQGPLGTAAWRSVSQQHGGDILETPQKA